MNTRSGSVAFCAALFWFLFPCNAALNKSVCEGSQTPAPQVNRTAQPAKAAPSPKNREAAEKEAAMTLKEQELKRISEHLEARRKEIEAAKKGAESSTSAKKQGEKENYKKMVKLYKTLKPAEAAKLLDKLEEELALEMLNQMDTKTAAKLIPLLNEKRVLKWTRLSLIRE